MISFQEDDEHTIEEDEAHITEEERKEELEALRDETDIQLEELLKHYTGDEGEFLLPLLLFLDVCSTS